ncbi:cytochrome P450 [Mycobacterium sp. shizuoka-1]|uniref:cytochrome P450 n=1 Tax=Mycobacterium sp. shizuoka-1 TaxID=2039281 RepID=UPI000C0620D3|nr:cytochrome P450 [Mycobacterium sp. shizuoka-1]GAY14714.1 cytochrome P450 [Mycobacterium sp. shizuoka-1]
MSTVIEKGPETDQAPLPPGPRYANPLKFFRELKADPLGYYRRIVSEYGDIGYIDMWPRPQVWTIRPEHYREILVKNVDNYPKGIAFERLKVIGGNGLFFSEGETWRKNRKLVSRSFTHRALGKLLIHISSAAVDFTDRMAARAGQPAFDIVPDMASVAMDVACRSFFGDDILDRAIPLSTALWETAEYADNAMNSLFPPPIWVPTRVNRKTKKALKVMFGTIDDLINDARQRGETENVLGKLITAVDNGELSPGELRDEMWTLLNAGHETTATTLGFAFHFLSQHPEARQRVEAEADALGHRAPTPDDVERLDFTRRVVMETLRLLPPAWGTSREAVSDGVVGGYRIPRKAIVQPLFFLTQRHPEFWDHPDDFDPDRFTPERSADRPAEAFSPFALGARRCIGERFAILEATLVLATFHQRLEFRLSPGFTVEPGLQGFGPMRALTGIPMTVHHRH